MPRRERKFRYCEKCGNPLAKGTRGKRCHKCLPHVELDQNKIKRGVCGYPGCGSILSPHNRSGVCAPHQKIMRYQCARTQATQIEWIRRKCLKCDRDFWAANRYIRLCGLCKQSNKEFCTYRNGALAVSVRQEIVQEALRV